MLDNFQCKHYMTRRVNKMGLQLQLNKEADIEPGLTFNSGFIFIMIFFNFHLAQEYVSLSKTVSQNTGTNLKS